MHATDIEQVAEDFCYSGKEINDIINMNRIANGDYWQDIIKKNLKGDGTVNGKQAEKEFTIAYVNELQKIFQYVISIPIRTGDALIPKYQMIYATEHIDGILYMANNMLECELEMQTDFSKGQPSFFDYCFTKTSCEAEVIKMLDKKFINAKQFCLDFYSQNGVKFLIKDINLALKNLEAQNKIEIQRTPSATPTGRTATATNILDSKYKMALRLK